MRRSGCAMPIYDYSHESCGLRWEVAKPMRESDTPEACPKCGEVGVKLPSLCAIDKTAAGGWNEQQMHPALGCYTRSTQHARKIAKSRGMEEVGTEPPEKIHAAMDRQRADTAERRWEDATREKVYE